MKNLLMENQTKHILKIYKTIYYAMNYYIISFILCGKLTEENK